MRVKKVRSNAIIPTYGSAEAAGADLYACLDGDVVIHVAPPSTAPVPELTEAFYVPKGTIVRMNTGVWHMAPFPVKEDLVHLMVALPERIYFNDCYVVEYEPDQYVEISL